MLNVNNTYERNKTRKICVIVALALFTFISALIFMTAFTPLSFSSIPGILIRFAENQYLETPEKIVVYMRAPAILMALIAGMALSLAGSVMQSITHNDLVSPFTLGVSAAAAFGASVCIVWGNSIVHSSIGMVIGAFISSLICIFIVYIISVKAGSSASTLVLVGIAMNYLFSALSAIVQFFAQEYKLGEIVHWTFGTFDKATWTTVGISFTVLVISTIIFHFFSLQLDAMSMNDDETVISLGINPKKLRITSGLVSVLLTSAIISFTGVIGFVGLISPHIARILVGNEHRLFLPMSAMIGACLLIYSDFVGKYILYPVSIPVGIVVSFIGVPVFVHLVMAMRRE